MVRSRRIEVCGGCEHFLRHRDHGVLCGLLIQADGWNPLAPGETVPEGEAYVLRWISVPSECRRLAEYKVLWKLGEL